MSKKKNKNKNIKTDYSSVLDKYNIRHYEDDYVIIGKFCNMSYSTKDWIETNRYKLQFSANKYEKLMGEYLVNAKIKFVHQAPFVLDGKIYFADFYIPAYRTVIEIDGTYHDSMTQSKKDNDRDYAFKCKGIKTIRLNNAETLDKNQIDIRLRFVK